MDPAALVAGVLIGERCSRCHSKRPAESSPAVAEAVPAKRALTAGKRIATEGRGVTGLIRRQREEYAAVDAQIQSFVAEQGWNVDPSMEAPLMERMMAWTQEPPNAANATEFLIETVRAIDEQKRNDGPPPTAVLFEPPDEKNERRCRRRKRTRGSAGAATDDPRFPWLRNVVQKHRNAFLDAVPFKPYCLGRSGYGMVPLRAAYYAHRSSAPRATPDDAWRYAENTCERLRRLSAIPENDPDASWRWLTEDGVLRQWLWFLLGRPLLRYAACGRGAGVLGSLRTRTVRKTLPPVRMMYERQRRTSSVFFGPNEPGRFWRS